MNLLVILSLGYENENSCKNHGLVHLAWVAINAKVNLNSVIICTRLGQEVARYFRPKRKIVRFRARHYKGWVLLK